MLCVLMQDLKEECFYELHGNSCHPGTFWAMFPTERTPHEEKEESETPGWVFHRAEAHAVVLWILLCPVDDCEQLCGNLSLYVHTMWDSNSSMCKEAGRSVDISLQAETSISFFHSCLCKAEWVLAGQGDYARGRDPADGGMADWGQDTVGSTVQLPSWLWVFCLKLPVFSTPTLHPAHSHPFLSNKYLW